MMITTMSSHVPELLPGAGTIALTPLPSALSTQLAATLAGVLLLSAVLLAWRLSARASIRLIALQGAALAALVATLGLEAGDPELIGTAVLVLVIKAVVLPWVLSRAARHSRTDRESTPRLGPALSVLAAAALIVLAYLVGQPLIAADSGFAADAIPVGLGLLLVGLLLMMTRRRAVSALVGFLMLDNGIAVVAFLLAGGLPVIVELGVLLDLLLVVLILQVLTARMPGKFGGTDLEDLSELHD